MTESCRRGERLMWWKSSGDLSQSCTVAPQKALLVVVEYVWTIDYTVERRLTNISLTRTEFI
jgi:hypothetical protein